MPKLKVGGGCLRAHMCAHNVIFVNFHSFGSFYECLTILRRVSFFTACSVHVGDFLPHAQYT
jgi:hypothetical protein